METEEEMKEGEKTSKLEIAKKMKEEKISVEQIKKFTGLTATEIEQL